jgi:hypothetical protein
MLVEKVASQTIFVEAQVCQNTMLSDLAADQHAVMEDHRISDTHMRLKYAYVPAPISECPQSNVLIIQNSKSLVFGMFPIPQPPVTGKDIL